MTELKNRQTLDRLIKKLLDDILVLGSMVEQAVVQAVVALEKRDLSAAERIYAGDVRINKRRFQIEEDCLALIATQQPIARDLRVLSSILEVNTELERMGDYGKGIARIVRELDKFDPIPFPDELPRMAAAAIDMLNKALDAFLNVDEQAARAIPELDYEVDHFYDRINRRLIKMVGKDRSIIDSANYMMWASHNLERLADRVTNICERTVFVATGEMIEFGKHLTVYKS
jgi:phosphate transport system protein